MRPRPAGLRTAGYAGGRSAAGDPDLIPGGPGYYGGPVHPDDDEFGGDLYRPSERDDLTGTGRRFGLPGRGGQDGRDPFGPGRRGSRGSGGSGRPPGNWFQRQWHASWWRHWTLKKASLLAGGMAAFMALALIAAYFVAYNHYAVPVKGIIAAQQQSSVVYFDNGHAVVGTFGSTNRTILTSADMKKNKYLEAAFVAAEDRGFWTEGGISLTGTARAILVDLTGKGYQGGSTITEQFIKTYLDPSGLGNLTYKDKLKEIIDAIQLARVKDKQWVLTHYLNAIYLGSGAYGVEAAAETYFGRHASQLGIGQSARLAAMVQEPSAFDPHHPAAVVPGLNESLLGRWVATVTNMARDTYPDGTPVITQQ
ncbi:MAG TPA: hypothetical protein DHU96_29455, partial [Actinobacteria bacterium]|nr:hypothetical protein [Actinomycetota bacterium]